MRRRQVRAKLNRNADQGDGTLLRGAHIRCSEGGFHHGWRGVDYVFNGAPWHAVCWHWQVNSNIPFASAQVVPQYFFPSMGTQLQDGCAHLDAAFIKAPHRYCTLGGHLLARYDTITPSKATSLFCFAHP
jgi:hypothetical protein